MQRIFIITLSLLPFQKMQRIEISEPIILCAYSFGCAVAFEMALLLEAQGKAVKLFLVDGAPEFVKKHTQLYKNKNDNANECDAFTYFITLFKELDLTEYQKVSKDNFNKTKLTTKYIFLTCSLYEMNLS